MEFPFAIGLFVAAAALTYVFCVRPMRRGQGHCGTGKPARQVGGDQQAHEGEAEDTARQRAEIARLREEIESLKAARR